MKHLLLCCAFAAFGAAATAQSSKGYESGYVVTNEGDTVEGDIKHRSGEEIKDRITLKVSEEDKRTYKTTEIRSFTAGTEEFITYKIDDETIFLRVWADGYYQLYEEQVSMEQSGGAYFKYQPYIRKNGEKELTPIKLGGWKKQVAELIADDTGLAADVEKNKYKLEELGTVIQEYNRGKTGE